MKPKIERLGACDTDPAQSATHICRLTGNLLSTSQIDTFVTIWDDNGVDILKAHAIKVLKALAQERMEEVAWEMRQEMKAAMKEAKTPVQILEFEQKSAEMESVIASFNVEKLTDILVSGMESAVRHAFVILTPPWIEVPKE